jgi:3-isopropylmalate dehydrogenase
MGEKLRRIAVLPGDGIGPEVIAEVVPLFDALTGGGVGPFEVEVLDWGADRLLATGEAMPADGFDRLAKFDAILLGAYGDPRILDPDYLRRLLLAMRFELDLFANLRPVRCLEERLNPLKGVKASEIDLIIVRENTEGMYSGVGGSVHVNTADEVALQEMVVTSRGVERVVRVAFDLAGTRPRAKVTLVDKANALPHAGALWQRVFSQVAAEFPAVETEHLYADVAAMEMIRNPGRFDVLVTENLFGDILSDLAAMLGGGLGLAPSANLHPGRVSMFEPGHGSAPDIAGTGLANPMAAFASLALLLRFLGEEDAARAIEWAIAAAVRAGRVTPDLGGVQATGEVGREVRRKTLERLSA